MYLKNKAYYKIEGECFDTITLGRIACVVIKNGDTVVSLFDAADVECIVRQDALLEYILFRPVMEPVED